MVATSQNGYYANNRNLIISVDIPGGRVSCRKDYGIPVIVKELFTRFHNEVESLKWPGNWGYAERPIRGSSTTLSNHASGTAWDANAPQHPLGKSGTFSASQVKAIKRILSDFDGVLRWGGNYNNRKDEMHFEIDKNEAACEALAKKIGKGTKANTPGEVKPKPKPKPKPGKKAPKFPYGKSHYIGEESNSKYSHSGALAKDRPNVRAVQQQLMFRGWTGLIPDHKGREYFGPNMKKIVGQFQDDKGLTKDYKVGENTWSELWEAPIT